MALVKSNGRSQPAIDGVLHRITTAPIHSRASKATLCSVLLGAEDVRRLDMQLVDLIWGRWK